MKFTHPTNRVYDGKAQVLEIEVSQGPDEWTLIANFNDPVRGIDGTVELIGYDLNSSILSLGRAVLQEYDAGRYFYVPNKDVQVTTETVRRTYIVQGKYEAIVSKKPNEYGEYVAEFRCNKVPMPDSDYFGTDYEDALHTARAVLLFMVANDK